jgi:hypothetical protein
MSGHEQISEVGQVTVAGVATEAKQDVQIAQGTVIEGKIDSVNSNLVIVQGKQDTTNTKIDSTNTKIDSTNTKLDTIDTDIKAEQPRIIRQNVIESISNNLYTNIDGSVTWYGVGESTLGVAGIQVYFAASTECHVEVQQSYDNINFDVIDTWVVPVGINLGRSLHGRTIQAVGSYFRIKVVNLWTVPTTYMRLSVALCPIVEALPRALTAQGNLKVCIRENEIGMSRRGNTISQNVISERQDYLLHNILTELEIMNEQLSVMSDNKITKKDKRLHKGY